LRARVIDEDFEENVSDYILACNAVNEIADEYFFAGLEVGVALVCDLNQVKNH